MATKEEILDIAKEDFALFIELGFVAVKYGSEQICASLFTAAQAIDQEHSAPLMGHAYIALNKMELDKAKTIYKKVLDKEKDNRMAKMFLGICHVLDKKNVDEGEKMIQEALDGAEDPSVTNLGETSLDWIKKEFKGDKGMFGA
ncbi:MAG: SctF chaperone SctG [Chlamydiales bacterium]|jgi:tetratricopeptide (TPR) repeat protein|nr:hypothetical protein [Chlamydiales bacterium]NCF70636.1 SctF chaperone SctG [Chlamydiales bacterium]